MTAILAFLASITSVATSLAGGGDGGTPVDVQWAASRREARTACDLGVVVAYVTESPDDESASSLPWRGELRSHQPALVRGCSDAERCDLLGDRQAAQARAGQRVDGVADRWCYRRHAGLAHARELCARVDDRDVDGRRFAHAHQLVAVEVTLHGRAILDVDLPV